MGYLLPPTPRHRCAPNMLQPGDPYCISMSMACYMNMIPDVTIKGIIKDLPQMESRLDNMYKQNLKEPDWDNGFHVINI